jgi:4-nitrophenyl phosphatase
MITKLTPKIKALIIDFDGVLWRGHEPIGSLPEVFAALQTGGWRLAFATNNSMYTPQHYQARLEKMGVKLTDPLIITSAMAVAFALKQKYPKGGPVYIFGEEGLRAALQDAGFWHQEHDVLAVVAGLDRGLTYDKIRTAASLIRQGAAFYGTNPDKTYPTPEGLAPGAGAALAAIEAASGTSPLIAGKPFPTLFEAARARLDAQPQETLVIGDRLDTDILGGQRAGMRTALVLSGVSRREELEEWHPRPDLVAETLADLIRQP